MNETEYLEDRVDKKIHYYSTAMSKAKRHHSGSQITIITLGLVVPVAVNLEHEWFSGVADEFLRILITCMSLATAVVSGIANFKKWGESVIIYQMTLEHLKRERSFFLTSSEKYREERNRFSLFVENIEKILSSEHEKFKALAKSKPGAKGSH